MYLIKGSVSAVGQVGVSTRWKQVASALKRPRRTSLWKQPGNTMRGYLECLRKRR